MGELLGHPHTVLGVHGSSLSPTNFFNIGHLPYAGHFKVVMNKPQLGKIPSPPIVVFHPYT